LVSLAAGFTDNETLPVDEVRSLLDEILAGRASGEQALQYGSTAGLPELRQETARRLYAQDRAALNARHDEGCYDPGSLVVTHGSQQLLYLITECLCDPGDIVLLEDPTYFVYLGIAQSHGLACRGIHIEEDGLSLDHLDETLADLRRGGKLKRLKALYMVSYFQNPTATTTSLARKAVVLRLLKKYERWAGHPIYVVEDAAYRELRFAGDDVPSTLVAVGAADRVIYAGTYSKPFATGVRVGFGRLPKAVLTAVVRSKANHDFGTSSLLQHLLVRALASGVYDRHMSGLRERYAAKARLMAAALRQHFPAAVSWKEPRGGMYVWASLPRPRRSGLRSAIFRRALERDVLYVPGRLCYADDPTRPAPDHEMRLSFGGADERAIAVGIERLGQVLHEYMP
jgi:2-aminoadipate transaminase